MFQSKFKPGIFALALVFICTIKAAAQTFPLTATAYDSHSELSWPVPTGTAPFSYKIWRSTDGQSYSQLKIIYPTNYMDFTGFNGGQSANFSYFVEALATNGDILATTDTVAVTVAPLSDDALMDMVQRYTFRYFWEFGHPVSGMARERNTSGDVVTSGGTGFGVMAMLVAAERGYITRQQALDRLLMMTSFLENADRFHGAFSHWLNGATGAVVPFSQYDNGGDLVETAFLMEGLLTARQYFDQNNPEEQLLREKITGLWEAVEWDWYRKNNSNVLYWHWSPNFGWQMNFQIRGYNEALIVYLLAIASPTHPVPASLWQTGWAGAGYVNGNTYYNLKLDVGPPKGGPLFFAHYSYLGFDPRGIKDAYTNYYIHNKHHSLINRQYCIVNPEGHQGYSADCWGLTASDDPLVGYLAHEPTSSGDNGTITPTAALSSMPYTPVESMAALKYFYREQGEKLWGQMGFFDAFNLDQNWFASSTLAIDQGPIICMIENYRSRLLWDLFMSNPEIQPALDAIGFVPDASATSEGTEGGLDWLVFPNPTDEALTVEFVLDKPQAVSLQVFNAQGALLRNVLEGKKLSVGLVSEQISLSDLPVGPYFLVLRIGAETNTEPFSKQ
ncbi:MAG: T9SS type A sorting domain-containing protein [Saprospiraceae bacterium]|nr:T9SS type A sorting domain-containing protein [Saprospiraceae bacterium]MCF8251678.1 T9SS type A sorting domain-containing protein [Saprospiraceae bacterium]MCF8283034.1 T9SS type A sorting domain-containing protein [Bacteroidales bacterium]MCF8311257.1 T9SS type A sorting domain-containing protein [Saprospiraceae bacterium]MCF8442041.1 T9SS type A sorting domain-containing protein [Saprospiraceae bacterium]